MRRISAFGLMMGLAAGGAHAGVRDCTPDQIKSADDGYGAPDVQGHRLFHGDIKNHQRFQLETSVYDHPVPGGQNGDVSVVVTPAGRVECLDPQHGWSRQTMMATPQRRALLIAMGDWRFDPVTVDGKPVRALVRVAIPEKVDFHFHEDMPAAPLSQMRVTLERSTCWTACSTYKVTVHGDGAVDYDGSAFVSVRGRHAWRIPPAEAAAPFTRLRTKDVWSAAGNWIAPITDNPTQTVTLTAGGQTRVIVDYVGQMVGMPATVSEAEKDIDATALTRDLIHLDGRGLALLDEETFPFKSIDGADLLARISVDREASEDMVLALLERGAPPDGGTGEWPAASNDTHIFFRQVQSRNWSRTIAWLKDHGYADQLDAYRPEHR